MTNQSCTEFIKNLIAAFPRFPVSKETAMLYNRKLQGYDLHEQQWERVLDSLIRNKTSEYLPYLTEITTTIDNIKRTVNDNNYGFMYFTDSRGNPNNAVRVKCVGGRWVHAIGPKAGQAPILPNGAVLDKTEPDKKPDPEPWDVPSKEDIDALINEIIENVAKYDKKKAIINPVKSVAEVTEPEEYPF